MLTYNSGANGHYISEHDQCKAGLPILNPSTWQVRVANGGTSNAKYITQLPFWRQADTFQDFPTSLLSVMGLHEGGRQCIQRSRRPHNMQRGTNPHRHPRQPGTIPNNIDTTTGSFATMMPIQTSTEGTTRGQQCLQSTIYQTNHKVDALPLWIPGQIDLAQSHHQKQHYVPYYLSIVFFLSLKYAFGIISMFFTLVRCSIILSRLFLTYLHPFFLSYVQIY